MFGSSQSNLGEEAQIKDLLNQFKDCIMKTGEDLNMLDGKFESDLRESCKPNLVNYMKSLVDLETRLALEKDAASEAMSKISSAFNFWDDQDWGDWVASPSTNIDDDYQEPEYDENGEPIESEWGLSRPSRRSSDAELDRIRGDEQFDLFQETLEKIKASRKSRRKLDPRVKQLKKLLATKQQVHTVPVTADDEEDEEIIASTQDTIPTDPITKKKITDPVKNVKCGHIYDRNGITEFLKAPNPRCPYMGCVNRAQIRPEDLIPDQELKEKIETLLAMEEADASESDAE